MRCSREEIEQELPQTSGEGMQSQLGTKALRAERKGLQDLFQSQLRLWYSTRKWNSLRCINEIRRCFSSRHSTLPTLRTRTHRPHTKLWLRVLIPLSQTTLTAQITPAVFNKRKSLNAVMHRWSQVTRLLNNKMPCFYLPLMTQNLVSCCCENKLH